MKPTIKIPKAIISIWKRELINISDCTAKTGITYKTIVRARDTRVCTRSVMDRINSYLLRERKRNNELRRALTK